MSCIKQWLSLTQPESNRLLGLETAEEYRQRWISIRVMYFTGFLVYVGFGIVATVLWPYLNTLDPTAGKEFLPYLFGITSLFQLIGSPFFGWLNNRISSARLPMAFFMIVFIIGEVLHAMVIDLPSYRKYMLLLSRALVGLSSVCCTIYRAYISSATTVAERTLTVSFLSLSQALGLLGASVVQPFFAMLGEEGFTVLGIFRFNMYTVIGWFCAALGVVNLLLYLPSIFQDSRIAVKEAMKNQGALSVSTVWKGMEIRYLPVSLMVVAFALLMFIYTAIQSLLSPIALDQFYWTSEESLFYLGILMTAGALVSCVLFLLLDWLCKRFSESHVLVYGAMFALFLSQLLMIPIGSESISAGLVDDSNSSTNASSGCPPTQEWCQWIPPLSKVQFTISYTLLCVSFSIGTTLSQAVFSKLLGPRPQGTWMALLTCAGSVARILGPGSVTVYVLFGTYWTFGFGSILTGLIFLWMWVYRDTLRPTPPAKVYATEEELKVLNSTKLTQ